MTDGATGLPRPAHALLLDFDGPICRLFAEYKAGDAAHDLRTFLCREAGISVPEEKRGPNPLALFQWTARTHPRIADAMERRLIEAEVKAATSAHPTAGAADVMKSATDRGLPVAVVSNNSDSAVSAYLDRHGLAGFVSSIVGREHGRPDLMKPHPHSLLRGCDALRVPPADSVLIGDSQSDIMAAHAAGAMSIGYAKAPDRIDGLRAVGADVIIESMADAWPTLDRV